MSPNFQRKEVNVREVAICAADRNVQNQIEILIKGGVSLPSLAPGIMQSTMVDNRGPKVSAIPHAIVLRLKVDEENLQQPIINICEQVLLTPFQAVCPEAFAVVGTPDVVFALGPPERVCCRNWSPVKGRANTVSSVWKGSSRVTSAFRNVDFPTCGPGSVNAVLGHHPMTLLDTNETN